MQRPTARNGFTLVELLVVIAIISILVSLTMAAVQKVRVRGQEVQCRTDIQQLDAALQNFKAKFGVYPPCYGGGTNGTFRLMTNYSSISTSDPEVVLLQQMFPRMSLTNNGLVNPTTNSAVNDTLDPNQCMVFFLSGGMYMSYAGFATTPSTPFAPPSATATSASRLNNGPFFDGFTASSKYITPAAYFSANGGGPAGSTSTQPWFIDPWGTPYLYLSTVQGNDYPFDSAFTYPTSTTFTSTTLTALKNPIALAPWQWTYPSTATPQGMRPSRDPNGKFFTPRGVQIYSAGRDKKFGSGLGQVFATLGASATASGTSVYALNAVGGDDYSNFQQTPLGTTD